MLLALAFLLAGVHLEADAKVRGRVLDVNIRLVNEGAPFTMNFPSMQIYDMELTPGEVRWSDDRMFAQVLCERRIGSRRLANARALDSAANDEAGRLQAARLAHAPGCAAGNHSGHHHPGATLN
jgi:hypothetical protein